MKYTNNVMSYRRIVMYQDLNSAGTIFGGTLAAWIDEGAAIYASCQMNTRSLVTKKMSELVFDKPANLGDVLEIWCDTVRPGKTSLTVSATVIRKSIDKNAAKDDIVCRCELVFVSVGEDRRPKVWNKDYVE